MSDQEVVDDDQLTSRKLSHTGRKEPWTRHRKQMDVGSGIEKFEDAIREKAEKYADTVTKDIDYDDDDTTIGYRMYSPKLCKKVPELYAQGYLDVQVAASLGISKQTFYNWINKYPEFKEAVQIGRTSGEDHYVKIGYNAIQGTHNYNGNMKVWEKFVNRQYGWKEREAKIAEIQQAATDAQLDEERKIEIMAEQELNKYECDE